VPVRIEEALGAAAMALICLISFGNVVVRYATNYLLRLHRGILGLPARLHDLRRRLRRLRLERAYPHHLLPRAHAAPAAPLCEIVTLLATTLMFSLIVYYGAQVTYDEWYWGETSPGLGYPAWIYTIWLPLLSVAIILRVFGRAFARLRRRVRGRGRPAMIDANLALLVTFVVLMLIGTPIAVALGIGGVVGILIGLDVVALGTVGTNTYNAVAKYPLIAIPLFILTGMMFERSGVARGSWVRAGLHRPAQGRARAGRDPRLPDHGRHVGLRPGRCGGGRHRDAALDDEGRLSQALLGQRHRGLGLHRDPDPALDRADHLFGAGAGHRSAGAVRRRLIPGLLLGLSIAIPTVILSRKHGFGAGEGSRAAALLAEPVAGDARTDGAGDHPRRPAQRAVHADGNGGRRRVLRAPRRHGPLSHHGLARRLRGAGREREDLGVLMLIISLAGLFAWAGSTMGAFRATAERSWAISDNQWIILLLMMVVLLLAGMVLDGISIYLITLPLLIPVVQAFGWSYVWFGIVMAINVAMGQFTPPVAVNLMVTAKIAGIPMESTFRWVGWLLLSMAVALALVIASPKSRSGCPGCSAIASHKKRQGRTMSDAERANEMTGGEALARMLQAHGAGPMFGMGGFQLLPFYDAVRGSASSTR
jgi:C4-dicarboxylate transporter, DctM subunit